MPPLISANSSDARPNAEAPVWFHRAELDTILHVYGQMVSAGEWRDYAINAQRDCAIFSIFKHASEQPLYRIEKRPALSRRQGAYAVVSAAGQILKRGHNLRAVMRIFNRKVARRPSD